MIYKKILNNGIKSKIRFSQRYLQDVLKGVSFAFPKSIFPELPYTISRTQPFLQAASTPEKIRNLSLATRSIECIVIQPGQVFSFWRAVGRPSAKLGYQESRSILNGQLVPSVGGGLCQLSGLIYHLCLEAGLEILERHAHSKDIYTEETRYTPLGSDATVAWGYKDFRFKNNLGMPLQFRFRVGEETLDIHLHSLEPITAHRVSFERLFETATHVEVLTNVDGHLHTRSEYQKLHI